MGIGILLIIVLAIVQINSVRQQEARAQALIVARNTSTAEAKVTETAQAQATALSAFNVIYENKSNIIFELPYGSLEHEEDEFVRNINTEIRLINFYLDVTFENPYDLSVGDWDYGLIFRETGKNNQFRLYVTSDKMWWLENWENEKNTSLSGKLDINVGGGEKNHIEFVANDDIGYLIVNDQFISQIDLSERNISGNILICTGFVNNHEIEGYSTKFEDLFIYDLNNRNNNINPTSTTTNSDNGSINPAITVNSKAFSPFYNDDYSGKFDFQIVFENEKGWTNNSDYSLSIETVVGGYTCGFNAPEEDECKITNFNGQDYVAR